MCTLIHFNQIQQLRSTARLSCLYNQIQRKTLQICQGFYFNLNKQERKKNWTRLVTTLTCRPPLHSHSDIFFQPSSKNKRSVLLAAFFITFQLFNSNISLKKDGLINSGKTHQTGCEHAFMGTT